MAVPAEDIAEIRLKGNAEVRFYFSEDGGILAVRHCYHKYL